MYLFSLIIDLRYCARIVFWRDFVILFCSGYNCAQVFGLFWHDQNFREILYLNEKVFEKRLLKYILLRGGGLKNLWLYKLQSVVNIYLNFSRVPGAGWNGFASFVACKLYGVLPMPLVGTLSCNCLFLVGGFYWRHLRQRVDRYVEYRGGAANLAGPWVLDDFPVYQI